MTSQFGLQTIAMHILTNISPSKGNLTMKFGQLMEYNKRNIVFSKIMGKMWQGDYSPTWFCFLEMLNIR